MKGLILAVLVIILVSGCVQTGHMATNIRETYSVSPEGFISYANRPPVEYREVPYNETEAVVIRKIIFNSRGQDIYSLLAIPKREGKLPAFVLLPAQSVTKEGEQKYLASALNNLGFITLSLDQRGVGETGGYVPDIGQDFQAFANGGEPVQHRMVYDVLRAYDLLRGLPQADSSRIYIAGESMGGRFAVIAGAMEPGIAGLLLISTAGYGLPQQGNPEAERFLKSIDPDHYIGKVSPRRMLMVHSEKDPVIPLESARETFDRAGEPKKLLVSEESFHGYYKPETPFPEMLEKELVGW